MSPVATPVNTNTSANRYTEGRTLPEPKKSSMIIPQSSCNNNSDNITNHHRARRKHAVIRVKTIASDNNYGVDDNCFSSSERDNSKVDDDDNEIGHRNRRIPSYYDDDRDDQDSDDYDNNAREHRWLSISGNIRQRQLVTVRRQNQWSKKVPNFKTFAGSFVLFTTAFFGVSKTTACPEIISTICHCDDLHNGIVLRCSHSDGPQAVHLLRANQVNLGLIQQLELQNSGLHRIPAGFFSGLFIKKLDLSHNNIVDIDENGFLGMNNVLQELILHHNNLTRLPTKALVPLSALLRLDVSNNSIGDIEAEHALPPLSKLYDISLADNRICQVHKNAFDDVKYSIQTINLGRNCLKEVPAPAIRGFKQLMALHLHNNNITTLSALSFMNLPLMNLLNLASNQISNIHKQTFLNVPNLRFLYLTGNRITDIRPHQFSSFEQLEMLDLTGNYLIQLQEDSFSNLQNLRQLYLGENRIATIQPRSFTNSSVVILVLNSNRLRELREGMFDGLSKLQQLALKDNQIRSIDQNSFYSNPSLAMIDLSHNELLDLPPSTFLAQINLFLIDLTGNKLMRTPYEAFSRRVKTVLLQENPLVCSERVHMLQQGMGIYVASSEDSVCRPNRNPTTYSSGNRSDNGIMTPTFTPNFTAGNDGETLFKQEKKLEPSKTQTIIRPMSTIENEITQPLSAISGRSDINKSRLIPVRPINAPDNVQPAVAPLAPQIPTITDQLPKNRLSPTPGHAVSNYGTDKYDNRELPEGFGRNNKTPSDANSNLYPFDNTNIIHPFPVPFLKRPPKLSQAYIAAPRSTPATDLTTMNRTISSEQTLPPSVVVADHIQSTNQNTVSPETETNRIEKVTMQNANEVQETGGQILFGLDSTERLERVAAPSMIILICLSTVAIVMGSVFIGLCIAKHRRMQMFRSSMTTDSAAAARTNAYVAAQLDMIYGTVQRNRNAPMPNGFEDGQPWIYTSNTYGSAGYYK